MLLHIIVSWLVSALALWIVAQIIPGIEVRGFGSALIATIVIAIVNDTVGWVLRILAFPLTLVTLGLFLLVINAFLLKLASLFTPGFRVRGFLSALIGSLVLTILTTILRHLVLYHGPLWTTL
ncbi:MAG TPA: phage holin family protein [Bryobacteraceae bacterium]|nr:phage holin family protein [Bryobacteraceae bacterium]